MSLLYQREEEKWSPLQRHFSTVLQDELTIVLDVFPGKKDANSSLSRKVRIFDINTKRRAGKLPATLCLQYANDAPPGAASQVGSRSTVPSHLTGAVHSQYKSHTNEHNT